jgi:hypothetical protein
MRRQSFPEVYNHCGRPHKGNTVLPARRVQGMPAYSQRFVGALLPLFSLPLFIADVMSLARASHMNHVT